MPALSRVYYGEFGLWVKLLKRESKLPLGHSTELHSKRLNGGAFTRVLQNCVTDYGTFNVEITSVDETIHVCRKGSYDTYPSS